MVPRLVSLGLRGWTVSDPIATAKQAQTRLSVAREEYSRAVLNALDSGVSVAALAGELGVSRQAVNQMRKRAKADKV